MNHHQENEVVYGDPFCGAKGKTFKTVGIPAGEWHAYPSSGDFP